MTLLSKAAAQEIEHKLNVWYDTEEFYEGDGFTEAVAAAFVAKVVAMGRVLTPAFLSENERRVLAEEARDAGIVLHDGGQGKSRQERINRDRVAKELDRLANSLEAQ